MQIEHNYSGFDEWLSDLPYRLRELDSTRVRLFIASCCEREQGNYAAFSLETHWGDPALLREAGNALWRLHQPDSAPYVRALARQLHEVTPDTENFRSLLTSAALDAAISLQEALEYLLDDNVAHCISICSLIRDTIEMYIEKKSDAPPPASVYSLFSSVELITDEINKQVADLRTLKELNEITPALADLFRRCATIGGKTNLGLSASI